MDTRHQNTPVQRALSDWLIALRTPAAFYPAILLAIQMVLAVALGWMARGTLDPAAAQGALLRFDPKAVTQVRIEGPGETLTLSRGEKGWSFADLGGFPAQGTKVSALLDRLAGLQRGLPVATSEAALARHKVGDEGFERRVTLEANGKPVATLILGDSPGFKRQFARPAGETVVYDLDLPLFEVSNRRDDWLVQDRLHLDQAQITAVATPDWKLSKNRDDWTLEGTTDKPDQAAVINLLGRLGNLNYRGILGTEDKPEYDQAAPVLDLTLVLAEGGTRHYRVSKLKDSQDYCLKAADQPWYFRLTDFDLEGLIGLDRDRLLGKAPPEPPAPEGSGAANDQPRDGEPTAAELEAADAEAAAALEAALTPEDEGPEAEPATPAAQ